MKLTPLQAIRRKCLDCSCKSKDEVANCPLTSCPLWNFRLGDLIDLPEKKPKPTTTQEEIKITTDKPTFQNKVESIRKIW